MIEQRRKRKLRRRQRGNSKLGYREKSAINLLRRVKAAVVLSRARLQALQEANGLWCVVDGSGNKVADGFNTHASVWHWIDRKE